MVLFKRKPVHYLPRPIIEDDNSEASLKTREETSEIFTDYEAYLQRMDFYKQRRFICEITGRSAQTFFEALQTEMAGSQEVDSTFPDALREPILRKVQFSTVSRIDNLVDQIFDDFKQDFYPGENVTVMLDDGQRLNGSVREKAKFPEYKRADGSIERKAFARYFVKLISRPDEEALVDDEHIVRDRRTFTKQMLRSFIKNTTDREAWTGAPWIVKHKFAEEYRIDGEVPPHLQYGNKQAEKKAKAAAARKGEQEGYNQFYAQIKLPELKPAIKGPKSKMSPEELNVIKQEQYEEYQRSLQGNPSFGMPPPMGYPYLPGPPGQPLLEMRHFQPPNGHSYPNLQQIIPKSSPKLPPPPPPIKYPIDDLEVPLSYDGVHRPAIRYLSKDAPVPGIAGQQEYQGVDADTVGLLLETWNTLNVYCEVLQLDSFTFDDYLEALRFSSEEVDCELFVEIHCAVLKKLVNGENDENGALQISLPDLPQDDMEEDDSMNTDSRLPTPTPEPEVPAKRNTRSSLNQVQNADDVRSEARSATAEIKFHRAAEMFDDYGWVERLRKRDFESGGWELIMVGLLHQLAGRSRLSEICNTILTHLAPLNAEPTIETARLQYSTLDVNLRTQALQTIIMLFLETKAVKVFLEDNSAEMTRYRKIKIEHQRARKDAIAKLKDLHSERRRLQPDEKSPTPIPEFADAVDADLPDPEVIDTEDEEPLTSRSLRRGNDRAAERKRKREQEQERKEKAADAKETKEKRAFDKVLKNIEKERTRIDEAEDAIADVDNDLREADCPRTRVLGKDRFWNRYYWFERNAMPYEGLIHSSTANAEYANGRLWVQGPDDIEREGFIDVSEEEKHRYYRQFRMTPAERKATEEGPTSVFTARQWGYYEEPEDVEMLIGWLDTRGFRELKLRKELLMQKDVITRYMEKRKAYLSRNEEEPEEPTTRMSTRTKTYVNENTHRCLKWKNETALRENGHKHVEAPPKPRGKSKKVVDDGVATRTTNRQGKPLTRQGTRYAF